MRTRRVTPFRRTWVPLLLATTAAISASLLPHSRPAAAAPDYMDPPAPPPLPWPEPSSSTPVYDVGYLPGGGGISATGDYRYSLPIEVPSGRAGMEPNLSLNYSSRGGNGTVGVGWSLDYGGSEIARCAKTFNVDGKTDSPNYATDDALCLDGQRLIQVGGTPLMGEGAEYRTHHDSFARIVAHGNQDGAPSSFEVFTKSGAIKTYSALSAHRIAEDDSVATVTPVWVLTEERDRNGNAVLYKYDVQSEATAPYAFEYHIAAIEYTAKRGDDGTLAELPSRKVKLEYAPRPDPSFHYRSGVRHQITERLHAIRLQAPNPVQPEIFGSYWLTYENLPEQQRSFLAAVKRDDPSHLSGLRERRFEWAHATRPEFDVHEIPHLQGDYHDHEPVVFDADNDGKDDLGLRNQLCRTTPGSAAPFDSCIPGAFVPAQPMDVNGDGQVDLLGWGDVLSWNESTQVFESLGYGAGASSLMIDVDGDGRIDSLFKVDITDAETPDLSEDGNESNDQLDTRQWQWQMRRNNGTGFDEPQIFSLPGWQVHQWSYDEPMVPTLLDLNGDGRGELHVGFNNHPNPGTQCAEGGAQIGWNYRALGMADGGAVVQEAAQVQGSTCRSVLVDLNGDGLKDRLRLAGPDSTVQFNTATSFLPPEPFSTDIYPRLGRHRFQVADIDGDGREDLLSSEEASSFEGLDHLPDTYMHVQRNEGLHRMSLGGPTYGVPALDPSDLPDGLQPHSPVIKTGDVNGDGLLDLVVLKRAKPHEDFPGYLTVRVLVQKWAPHDVIQRVWDREGTVPRETVFYSAVPTYTPSEPACAYPSRCVRGGMVTAREHWIHRHDAPGAIRSTTYDFDDPRSDLRGRGFLGFGKVHIVDGQSFAETILLFDHQTAADGRYPFAGLPSEVWRYVPILSEHPAAAGGGVAIPPPGTPITARISHTRNTHEMRSLNDGGTYAVFPTEYRVDEWEQHVTLGQTGVQLLDDGSATPPRIREGTRTFDDFGNELTSKAWTVGGQRCETSTTYDYRPTDWLIGLPLTAEVTCNTDGLPLPEARLSSMHHDARGQLDQATVEPNHTELTRVTTYQRNAYGLVTKVTESATGELPRKTYLAYDDENVFVRATWNDLGHYNQQLIHPALGVPLVGQDPNGVQVRYTYDKMGRVVGIDADDGPSTTVSYDPDPDHPWATLVSRTSEDGSESTVRVDEWGRTLETAHRGFDGSWIHGRTGYNRFGRAAEIYRPAAGQAPSLKTDVTFDTLGRTVSVFEPGGATTTMAHSMFETITTDPEGRLSRLTRDVDDRVIEAANYHDNQWVGMTYLYGAFSQVEDVVDPAGNVVHAMYDKLGRRFLLDDPDRGTAMWSHNAFGEVMSELDALGDTTTLARDVLGRVTWMTHDQNGITTFDYDGNGDPGELGRLTHASSPDGVEISNHYDDLGRNITATWQIGSRSYQVGRKYDDFGRVESIEYPNVPGRDRFVVKREYNPWGYAHELFDATRPSSPKPIWAVTDRNETGLLRTSVSNNGVVETRQFDPMTGRLTNIEAVKDGSALYALHYVRDFTGNILERHDYAQPAPRVETFVYDSLDRLEHWTVQHANEARQTHYGYDLLGNIETITGGSSPEVHSHDGVMQNGSLKMPHALTARSAGGQSTSYFYDDRGRQTSGGGRTIAYKPFDLPAEIEQNGFTTVFSYDPFGTRIRKERKVTGGSVAVDGVDTIGGLYERRWKGNAPAQHVFYVHGTDGPVAQVVYDEDPNEPEKVLYLHQETLGSVGLVTDNLGEELERTYFDPFGARTDAWGEVTSPEMDDVKLGFTGHRHDDELGLINMRGRIYDPAQKRFLSPDPFIPNPLFGQSYNRYSYVHNNPLRYTDPTGFQSVPADLQSPDAPASPEGTGGDASVRSVSYPIPGGVYTEITAKVSKSDGSGYTPPADAAKEGKWEITVEEGTDEGRARAKQWSFVKGFIWGATKQLASSLPPVGMARQINHNLQIVRATLNHAAEGDWDLAGVAILGLPQENLEGVASIITGPIEALLSLPASLDAAINAADPEVRGAAGVVAIQQVATVVMAALNAAKGAAKALPPHTSAKPPIETPQNGTFYVDRNGNSIPTPPGGGIGASSDGKFIQAKDGSGAVTGVRIDDAHHANRHRDPRALAPHAHVPGVTNPDGTPWLPIK